jgi:hypothetical protein
LLPSSAGAYNRASVDGSPGTYLFWKKRTVTWYMDAAGSKDVPQNEALGAIKRAFFSWAGPSCTDVYFDYGGLSHGGTSNLVLPAGAAPDLKNTVTWHSQWPPAGAGDSSVSSDTISQTTLIYLTDTGEIVDADIDLNGQSKFWTSTDDPTKVVYDIQTVLTVEVGHLLGLARSDHVDAAMYGEINEGEIKRTLHQDDIDGLCWTYPFKDTTPTGVGQSIPPPQITGAPGCSVAGRGPQRGAGAWWLLTVALLGLCLARRRQGR